MSHKNRFQILYIYIYIYVEKVKRTLIKYVYNWDETQTKISNIIWIYIWGKVTRTLIKYVYIATLK